MPSPKATCTTSLACIAKKCPLAANKAYVNDLASPENEHDFTLMPQPVLIKPSQSAALSLKRIGTGVIIGLTISGVATLFAIKFSQNGLEKKHEIEAHQEQLRKLRYEIKAIELQKAAIDISFNDRTKNGFPKLQKGKTNQAMLAWALVFKEIGVQEKRTDTEYKALIDQLFEKRITVLKAELKRVKSIE